LISASASWRSLVSFGFFALDGLTFCVIVASASQNKLEREVPR
jgi:hypothetical protein